MNPTLRILAKALKFYWLPLIITLAGCQSHPSIPGMKLGKPYVVDGKTYYPDYDPCYDKIGMASWYGPGFHGKYTDSGEIYNQNDLTAAHPTLPMPSLVRVTNLTNGKSLIVRVNDRGPFKSNRIIDLSKKAAHELGVTSTAEVRVQFLKKETEELIASTQTKNPKLDMTSYNASIANEKDSSIIQSTEPNDQVVESTVSTSHTGQNINSAAPIVTVQSDDIEAPNGNDETASKSKKISANAVELTVPPQLGVIPTKRIEPREAHEVKISGMSDMHTSVDAPEKPVETKKTAVVSKAKVALGGDVPSTFYIQAGSFASEENAHKLSTKIETIAKTEIGKVEMGAKVWWRVRLGPFSNKNESTEALNRVHEAGVNDARIVHQ